MTLQKQDPEVLLASQYCFCDYQLESACGQTPEIKTPILAKPVALKPAPLKLCKIKSEPIPALSNDIDDSENMDEKVERIINSTYPENMQSCNGVKGGSKRRLFHLRQDVITKTIFRSLRKYYLKDFRAYFDFTKETSLNHQNEDEKLLKKADSYLTKTVGEYVSEKTKIYLLSLLDTKRRFISLNRTNEDIRQRLAGLLYTFNKNKMEELMATPEFCALVLYFLTQEEIINTVVKVRSDQMTLRAYTEQIERLKLQCLATIRQ